ncbi:MAG TPA: HDOD domain-containing protein [Burkholderiaceae bacterium]|nr:HDOD domain-containing protein [Burkholderiaceae bacterium]
MASWAGRLLRWAFGTRAKPTKQAALQPRPGIALVAGSADPPGALTAGASQASADELELHFFEWLIGDTPAALDASVEERLLAHVDAVSSSEQLREDLLPRARSVIPELLHSLRDDTRSVRALSARVARDPNLVVEVIRLANAVAYRPDSQVVDLMHAVSRLGTEGLRRAIARVLLKPIFDAQADPLLGRATQRLWQHSELKAGLCLQQAGSVGLDPFESYLAGLMHNVGWTALLRAIDRSPDGVPQHFSCAIILALAPRRERLFALFARSWQLSDALTSLAQEILDVGLPNARQPLAQLLLYADRAACYQLLAPPDKPSSSTDSAGV